MLLRLVAASLVCAALAGAGCALGDEEPGCQSNNECPEGFTCRAGACFRITTDLSPPAGTGGADGGTDAGTDADTGADRGADTGVGE